MAAPLTQEQRALVLEAVRAASRARILPRFRALTPDMIATKSGPIDLVTVADREAEADIAAAVRAGWPEAAVAGEESVAADASLRALMGTADPCVVIDPIDGTWNFANGLSTFGVLVAVLRGGRPAWGLLYDPLLDDWMEAGGDGPATFADARGRRLALSTSREARPSRLTGFVTLGLHRKEDRPAIAATFPSFLRVSTLRCAVHEYRMVAQGSAEFMLSGPTPHPWDHAAGCLVVERAGGVARFLDGSPYDAARRKGTLLVAGSEEAWRGLAATFSFLSR